MTKDNWDYILDYIKEQKAVLAHRFLNKNYPPSVKKQ